MIPIFSIFLVANIGIRFLVLSILIVIFSLIFPGTFLLKYFKFKAANFLESVVIGVTLASSIALLVHPILGLFGIARYTYIVFIIIGFIFLGFNLSKLSIRFLKHNFKIPALVSFILIPYGLWIGRQANVVPINNFDKYSISPDIYHHMSIAAEIGNHGPAIYPYIAGSGVALQYHWGAFSLGSFLSAGGLIPLAIAMYRLEFILLSFLLLALLFFTGKFVGKSNLSGVVAALFGVLTIYPSFEISDGLRVPLIRTGSISQLAACVFLVAALRVLYEVIENKNFKNSQLFILTILVMATTLSKGPTGLLLLGIIGLTSLIFIYQRNFQSGLKLSIGPLLGFGLIFPIIFSFGPTKSTGMSLWISPLTTVKTIIEYMGEPINSRNLTIVTILLVVSCLTPIIFLMLNLSTKPTYLIPIFVAIMIGTIGLFIFEAWGNSQWFIYYPVGPLIAIALAATLPKVLETFSTIHLITFIVMGLVVQKSLILLLRNWFEPSALNFGALWVVSVIFIAVTSFLLANSMWNYDLRKSFLAASISLLFVGFFSSLEYKDQYPYPVSNYEHPWSITLGTDAATKYLKENSSIDDVIATNRHCVGLEEKNTCIARVFTISALAERRTFIEGWAYTTCPVSEALNNSYWDQPLLALNQKVVVESDKTSAVELSKYGVQWLLIDLRRPHSHDYSNIATKEFSAGEVEVWKLAEKTNPEVKPVLSGCKSL
ncbi:hypothetical protein GM51_4770 [freshwater metagenome]|uniref:Uncharacterized protein n=1 Tax=freshwater metagenome TaxID=449393 RepID=A0A094QF55_9ZZZZ